MPEYVLGYPAMVMVVADSERAARQIAVERLVEQLEQGVITSGDFELVETEP